MSISSSSSAVALCLVGINAASCADIAVALFKTSFRWPQMMAWFSVQIPAGSNDFLDHHLTTLSQCSERNSLETQQSGRASGVTDHTQVAQDSKQNSLSTFKSTRNSRKHTQVEDFRICKERAHRQSPGGRRYPYRPPPNRPPACCCCCWAGAVGAGPGENKPLRPPLLPPPAPPQRYT